MTKTLDQLLQIKHDYNLENVTPIVIDYLKFKPIYKKHTIDYLRGFYKLKCQ